MRRRDGKPAANNSSGVTGVCPHNTTNSWRAYLGHNRYRYFLGDFPTVELAIAARRRAERTLSDAIAIGLVK